MFQIKLISSPGEFYDNFLLSSVYCIFIGKVQFSLNIFKFGRRICLNSLVPFSSYKFELDQFRYV